MEDGFRKDWVIDHLEGNEGKEQRRVESEARDLKLEGLRVTDEQEFAFMIPKVCYYAQCSGPGLAPLALLDEIMDSGEVAFGTWGMDFNMPEPMCDLRDEEGLNESDGYISMIGGICDTIADYKIA